MESQLIRVFPRRTSYTPNDHMVFIGDPPLFRPMAKEVHISVTFTWDRKEGERLQKAWGQYYPIVKLGGPAIDGEGGEFTPGFYLKEGVTITTRGCIKKCPWCLVGGNFRLLEIKPGWIISDNNLLAASQEHLQQVFEMLREQNKPIDFPGGIDSSLITPWVVEQFKTLKISEMFFAADNEAGLKRLEAITPYFEWLKIRQKRCYVLIGFNGENLDEAEKRLEKVLLLGFLPFAQLYQPPDRFIKYNHGWRSLARRWSRPAIMLANDRAGEH